VAAIIPHLTTAPIRNPSVLGSQSSRHEPDPSYLPIPPGCAG
jgi:hypothetical protein